MKSWFVQWTTGKSYSEYTVLGEYLISYPGKEIAPSIESVIWSSMKQNFLNEEWDPLTGAWRLQFSDTFFSMSFKFVRITDAGIGDFNKWRKKKASSASGLRTSDGWVAPLHKWTILVPWWYKEAACNLKSRGPILEEFDCINAKIVLRKQLGE